MGNDSPSRADAQDGTQIHETEADGKGVPNEDPQAPPFLAELQPPEERGMAAADHDPSQTQAPVPEVPFQAHSQSAAAAPASSPADETSPALSGAGGGKRPQSWGELSQSFVEVAGASMAGAMRAAKEGVASVILALAEADPFSEVSLPSAVHMMGVTYDLALPNAPLNTTGGGGAVLGTSQLSSSVGAAGKEGAQKQHLAGSASALASSTMSTSSLMGEGPRLFRLDMKSRLWFTYRHSLAPINASGAAITSDSGWGCMLRSAQMMMAQALVVHALGREWRLPDLPFQDLPTAYRTILGLFADHPSAPMSIHSIARAGEENGKKAGQWLGPNTVCAAIQRLHTRGAFSAVEGVASGEASGRDLQLLLFDSVDGDNTIYKSECLESLADGRSLLVLVPVRLGAHNIDRSYVPKVSALLKLPQSVGFIGGRPRSAHYFVATRGRLVYFLDPHQTQPYVPLGDGKEGPRQHASWHCDIQRRMSLADIDASLTFGFYCRDVGELDQLCSSISALNSAMGGYAAVSVADERRKMDAGDWDDDDGDDEEGELDKAEAQSWEETVDGGEVGGQIGGK